MSARALSYVPSPSHMALVQLRMTYMLLKNHLPVFILCITSFEVSLLSHMLSSFVAAREGLTTLMIENGNLMVIANITKFTAFGSNPGRFPFPFRFDSCNLSSPKNANCVLLHMNESVWGASGWPWQYSWPSTEDTKSADIVYIQHNNFLLKSIDNNICCYITFWVSSLELFQ